MMHPLTRRVALLRRRDRRLAVVRGAGWVVSAALGAAIVLGLLDYLFRLQDPGLRIIWTLALASATLWAAYRDLYLPLSVRPRDVDLALRVERRYPGLHDRLASAVEFLDQDEEDPLAGSAALRRAVIVQAAAEVEPLDFYAVLDRRRPARAALVSAAVLLVAAILVVLDPAAGRVAVARLVHPLGNTPWPQKTHLALVERVERVARGGPFEVEVVDARGARLPDDVRIHYRFDGADGPAALESEPMSRFGEAMRARREAVARPFSYRVEGGDDRSMPWIAVEVVEPPEVVELAVELTPPGYTGWPPERTDGAVHALVGTRMAVRARASKPLQSAALRFEEGRRVEAALSPDGLEIRVPGDAEPAIVVETSAAYWFELVDREDIAGGADTRWELRGLPDSPPTAAIEEPATNVYVTSSAVVPLRVSAKDDLAVRRIALVVGQSDAAGPTPAADEASAVATPPESAETEIALYEGPERPEPPPSGEPWTRLLAAGGMPGRRRLAEYSWDIAGMNLPPGTQRTFHAVAFDYAGQTGRSEPRRLIVITELELQERMAGRQRAILAELRRILDMQQQARSHVDAGQIRLAETGRVEPADVGPLQAAELTQRQVQRSLTSPGEGVPVLVVALLADLVNNRVDNADLERRMRGLLDEIDRLDREHLGAAAHELTSAVKDAQVRVAGPSRPVEADAPLVVSLDAAAGHQDRVVESLAAMIEQLAQWDSYRRFYRELSQLLRDQEELTRRTGEVGLRTLTRDVKDLSPQETAELKVLASGQTDLARRLEAIQHAMGEIDAELRQSDPLAAETVAEALDEARRLALSARMRASADHLRQNRVGQATAEQKRAAEDIQSILDILANRREQELDRLVGKLKEAEADLTAIEREQSELRRGLEDASVLPDDDARKQRLDALARRQEELRQQTERLSRRLERLGAERAAGAGQRAAGQMAGASEGAAAGQGGEAARQAGEAQRSLADARRELAARRLQAQAELAMEQLARLEDAIKHLRRQEENVLDETRRLEAVRQADGRLARSQLISLADLARLQRMLESETARLADDLAAAGAFHLALGSAGREMGLAAGWLERQQTGPETQHAVERAIRQLGLILEALEPDEPDDASQSPGGGDTPGGGQPGGVQTLAELKLLKLMQVDLNLRTKELDDAVAVAAGATPEQQTEYGFLAGQQGRLAELILELIEPEPDGAEEAMP